MVKNPTNIVERNIEIYCSEMVKNLSKIFYQAGDKFEIYFSQMHKNKYKNSENYSFPSLS